MVVVVCCSVPLPPLVRLCVRLCLSAALLLLAMRSEWPKYRLSVAAVCVLLLLDVLFSVLAYLSLHRYSVHSELVSWSAFTSFRRDALDTVFTCLLRVSLLVVVFGCCLLYATPDYDTALDEKRRQTRLHNRRVSRRSEAGERSVSLSINSGSHSEPLLQPNNRELPADSVSPSTLIPMPDSLTQTEKHTVNQRCSRYRLAGYVFIFVLCTAMQVSIGVKVVSFDFPRDAAEWPIALFLSLPILFINIEQHYCSRIIGKMTREEGTTLSAHTAAPPPVLSYSINSTGLISYISAALYRCLTLRLC